MNTMNFEGPGFTMQVPTNWVVTSSPQIQAMFVSPPRQGGRANFMVTIRPVNQDVTLEQVAASALETQKKEYEKFDLLETSEFRLGELVGTQRHYTWFSQEHNAPIRQRQVILVTGGLMFTITLTRTDVKELEELDAILAEMLASFKLA